MLSRQTLLPAEEQTDRINAWTLHTFPHLHAHLYIHLHAEGEAGESAGIFRQMRNPSHLCKACPLAAGQQKDQSCQILRAPLTEVEVWTQHPVIQWEREHRSHSSVTEKHSVTMRPDVRMERRPGMKEKQKSRPMVSHVTPTWANM